MDILSTCLQTSFLITMGGNGISPDSIIHNTQSKYCIECKDSNEFDKRYVSLYTELSSYRELQENWDGYGGIKPDDEMISTTRKFLNILKENQIAEPKIMLTGSGEIGLFWKNKNHYIEVDFDKNKYLSFFYEIDGKLHGEDDILIDDILPDKLNYVLHNLHRQNNIKQKEYLVPNIQSMSSTTFLT